MKEFTPPYLGAAYYPEDWPLEQIDQDIALMKQAGMNVMRIGEFAWSRMEPVEDQFELQWLHLVMEKLSDAGIATIMCTPTCTPPIWLTEKHPEVLVVKDDCRRSQHGGRRHACPNNPAYRTYTARIVKKLAEEFGRDDRIIGWQIDNELYPDGPRGCCCSVCRREFHRYLKDLFGTIENLNQTWGTDLWSQMYQDFSQIPIPHSDTWHHPSLLTAWMTFQSDSYVDFSNYQAAILHKYVKQPVGTDMMPFNGLNHYDINQNLDLIQFNHYHSMENLWESAFWMDFLRPLKDRPFWNTETATCWSGATTANGYKEPGFCRVNSWIPVALGGEANLYWLWRSHWSGQELMHGSVISSSGRPLHIFDEVKEISEGFQAAADFLNGTRPTKSELALHFSGLAWWMFQFQPLVHGFNYHRALTEKVYHPLIQVQMRPDVIDPAESLDPYKLVFSPFLPALDERGFRERIFQWIENGGTWMVGPMSDIRTIHATKYTHAPFGSLEEWAGVETVYEVPGHPRDFALSWSDGTPSKGSIWYSGFKAKEGTEVLAKYTEYPFTGLAAVTNRKVGDGQIVCFGTMPTSEDIKNVIVSIASNENVYFAPEATSNLLVIPREGPAGKGIIVIELENRPGSVVLHQTAKELLTGETRSGMIDVDPYDVMVFQFSGAGA